MRFSDKAWMVALIAAVLMLIGWSLPFVFFTVDIPEGHPVRFKLSWLWGLIYAESCDPLWVTCVGRFTYSTGLDGIIGVFVLIPVILTLFGAWKAKQESERAAKIGLTAGIVNLVLTIVSYGLSWQYLGLYWWWLDGSRYPFIGFFLLLIGSIAGILSFNTIRKKTQNSDKF